MAASAPRRPRRPRRDFHHRVHLGRRPHRRGLAWRNHGRATPTAPTRSLAARWLQWARWLDDGQWAMARGARLRGLALRGSELLGYWQHAEHRTLHRTAPRPHTPIAADDCQQPWYCYSRENPCMSLQVAMQRLHTASSSTSTSTSTAPVPAPARAPASAHDVVRLRHFLPASTQKHLERLRAPRLWLCEPAASAAVSLPARAPPAPPQSHYRYSLTQPVSYRSRRTQS